MKRGDELTVSVEDFALEGRCVARVEGLVVFVRGAVPGDRARIRITRTKRNYADAECLELLERSPHRTDPRCRYFGVCGGCTWQHVAYDVQTAFKRRHVIDCLERLGGFPGVTVSETLRAPEPYYYRNKMEFSFGERWLTREEMEGGGNADRFALGLHIPQRFDRVLDVEECFLQSPVSVRIVNAVRNFCRERRLSVYSTATHRGYLRNLVIRQGTRTGDVMVNLVTSDEREDVVRPMAAQVRAAAPEVTTFVNNVTTRKSQVAVGDREVVIEGPGFITEVLGSRRYRISANSFFQTNTAQAERLYDRVRDVASLRPQDVVWDLYCGTGTIALHLAGDVAEVVGVESVAAAVADAQRNAELNGVTNCRFVCATMEEALSRDTGWMQSVPAPHVIVLDPPRAGVHDKVLRRIAELAPDRIVYVSCNPSTQARDLKTLVSMVPYTIREVVPVDMFPQTSHVESIVALVHERAIQ